MTTTFAAATGLLATLDLLRIEGDGPVLHLRLMRPAKRNAINDTLMQQIHTAMLNLPAQARALVLSGEGDHFCAGLDLSELSEKSAFEGVRHFRVAAGAGVAKGIELAAKIATHAPLSN